MPNSKQSAKRLLQSEKRNITNKMARTAMRSAMKKVTEAESKEAAAAALPMAMKKIDKAAKKNVVHANAAARLKGQVSRAAQ
ncbi:MAG: small subunit ribosomal protein S20 [Planctomycetota bacterium]|jgi:small subunit ribosomal protein S20